MLTHARLLHLVVHLRRRRRSDALSGETGPVVLYREARGKATAAYRG